MSHDEKHFMDGISRKKVGLSFEYFYNDTGKKVSDKDMERIKKLRIPPAWNNVWVAKDANNPIQAIGVDSKGRKQYRYHDVHIEKATKEKFLRLYEFIKKIPRLEKKLSEHTSINMYNKIRVVSLMVQIVKEYYIRVGKEVYARKNKSYGISSMRKKHVKINGGTMTFNFKGKSNQRLNYVIKDSYIIESIKLLLKLNGDKLFQYVQIDENGNEKITKVSDTDLNDYIKENMGNDFTIKDFRTYGANYYFIKALLNETKKRTPKDDKIIKKNIKLATISAAKHLKHTGSVSKKSYVMDYTIELYRNNPQFFTQHKNDNCNDVLITILNMYKRDVLDV